MVKKRRRKRQRAGGEVLSAHAVQASHSVENSNSQTMASAIPPGVVAHKQPVSPLLRSAFEVLNHGLYHFFRSETATDMKFALMHVDQAIELILKECVRAGGKSVYKNPKETISVYGAYDILQNELNIKIPEKPDLELLHEERNNIQHKYSNPSPQDAGFHIQRATAFIRRFVQQQLNLDIKDFVASEFLDQLLD
jgi:hypothetical protein